MLTIAAVRKLKGHAKRREVPDGRGLCLVIQPKTSSKSWALRYKVGRKNRKLTLGTCDETGAELEGEPVIGGHLTLGAARKLASEALRQVALGRDPAAERRVERTHAALASLDAGARNFARGAADYYRDEAVGRKHNRSWRENARLIGLEYQTDDERAEEPKLIPGGLAERWRDLPVSDITPSELFKLIDECRSSGIPGRARARKRGPVQSRAREMAAAITPLLDWLVKERHWAEINPAASLGNRRQGPARERVLTNEEIAALWRATEGMTNHTGRFARLLLLTGCRVEEVSKMRWSEIDDSTLRLDGSRTKNKRPHDVWLSPLAKSILAEVKRVEGCDFVFTTNGRGPSWPCSKAKREIDERMSAEHWTLHDLRRTAATGMNDLGVEPHIVEAALNHVSGTKGGVAGVYNRARYWKQRVAALGRWSKHVEALISSKAEDNVVAMRRKA